MTGRSGYGALWAYLIAILALAVVTVALAWIFGPTVLPAPSPRTESTAGSAAALSGAPLAPGAALHAMIMTEGVKAALQLAVIVVIGGLAKFLFDRLQAVRIRREGALEIQKEFLRRLRAVQAQVSRTRETLRADESAEAYRVQMQELMNARSGLFGLSQELQAANNAMEGRGRTVADELRPPEIYLDAVIEEWTQQYPVVKAMQQQNRDPQDIINHLKNYCPKLRELCDAPEEGNYRAKFLGRIEFAAMLLLRGILAETA